MKNIEYKKNRGMAFFVWGFLSILGLVCALAMQRYLVAALAVGLSYFVHAVFLTDHIFYNPARDYNFKFRAALSFNGAISCKKFTLHSSLPQCIDTCFLPIRVTSKIVGNLFDPYVELRANGVKSRQYFERGVKGLRYINLTLFVDSLVARSESIHFICRHCDISDGEFALLGFDNSSYSRKKILVIAPHADDAELAAFGFYKHAESAMIVTVTAGEVDASSYEIIAGNKTEAVTLKGRLRAWDSIAVPIWAGHHVQSVHLGYFCMTLKKMHEQPDVVVASRETDATSVQVFRQFNGRALVSDQRAENKWNNLVADLRELIDEYKPDILVAPHPKIDPHPDHIFSTRAVFEACEILNICPHFLLYANHSHHTDMYPFGVEHSDLALPPHFDNEIVADQLFSVLLSADDQRDKVCALKMMHDLNRPTSFKKRLRQLLQRLIGRSAMPYGNDDYLRKAIRQQELFFVTSMLELRKLFGP